MIQDESAEKLKRSDRATFIMTPYIILWKYGSASMAVVYGRIENLTFAFGSSTCSEQTLADWCGLSKSTTRRVIKELIKEGYIVDLNPNLRNIPHELVITNKYQEEEDEFFDYYDKKKEELGEHKKELARELNLSDRSKIQAADPKQYFYYKQFLAMKRESGS
jgi:DNA-binding MarR family transcriptional regulator